MSATEDFKNAVRGGFRLAADLAVLAVEKGTAAAEKAQRGVVAYLRLVGIWSFRILIAALVPLAVIIPCLAFRAPLGWLYGGFVVYCTFLLFAELVLLLPIAFTWRLIIKTGVLGSYPDEWRGSIKNVVFNGLSLALFAALIPVWMLPGAYPLLLLILGCWLAFPLCSISSICKRIYPSIRAFQFGLLAFLLVTHIIVPEYLEAIIVKTPAVPGLMQKKEITAQWRTITWFDNLGHPKVWYSGSANQGYRLWDGMGYDNDTREKLRPVENVATKNEIVALLDNNDRIQKERQAIRQAELDAQLNDAERAESERQAVQRAEKIAQAEVVARQQEAMEQDAQERQKLLAVAQKEITSQWKMIVWFNNAGMPNVWYSGSDSNGYRLWAGIGFDPNTGETLKSVSDEAIKSRIVSSLAEGEQLEKEAQARLQAAEDRRLKKNLAEEQREKAEMSAQIDGEALQQRLREEELARARYLSVKSLSNTVDTVSVAMLIIDDRLAPADDWMFKVVSLAQTNGLKLYSNPFDPAFVREGLFESFMGGRGRDLALELRFDNRFDRLWLGQVHKTTSVKTDSHGLTTMTGSIRLCEVSCKNGDLLHEFTAKADAVAMSASTAEEKLDSRIIDELGKQISVWVAPNLEKYK